jgi:hypothetical protein
MTFSNVILYLQPMKTSEPRWDKNYGTILDYNAKRARARTSKPQWFSDFFGGTP